MWTFDQTILIPVQKYLFSSPPLSPSLPPSAGSSNHHVRHHHHHHVGCPSRGWFRERPLRRRSGYASWARAQHRRHTGSSILRMYGIQCYVYSATCSMACSVTCVVCVQCYGWVRINEKSLCSGQFHILKRCTHIHTQAHMDACITTCNAIYTYKQTYTHNMHTHTGSSRSPASQQCLNGRRPPTKQNITPLRPMRHQRFQSETNLLTIRQNCPAQRGLVSSTGALSLPWVPDGLAVLAEDQTV